MNQKTAKEVQYIAAEKEALNHLLKQLVVQWKKWGLQRHTYWEWKAILNEELAEMGTEVIVAKKDGYEELTHCAAVCVAWMINLIISKGVVE